MNESLKMFFSGEVILYDSIIQNGGWVGEYKTLNLLKPIEFYKTKGGLLIYEGLLKIIYAEIMWLYYKHMKWSFFWVRKKTTAHQGYFGNE